MLSPLVLNYSKVPPTLNVMVISQTDGSQVGSAMPLPSGNLRSPGQSCVPKATVFQGTKNGDDFHTFYMRNTKILESYTPPPQPSIHHIFLSTWMKRGR